MVFFAHAQSFDVPQAEDLEVFEAGEVLPALVLRVIVHEVYLYLGHLLWLVNRCQKVAAAVRQLKHSQISDSFDEIN